jgi:hypothetical protein
MVPGDPGGLGELAARWGHSAAIPWNASMMRSESFKSRGRVVAAYHRRLKAEAKEGANTCGRSRQRRGRFARPSPGFPFDLEPCRVLGWWQPTEVLAASAFHRSRHRRLVEALAHGVWNIPISGYRLRSSVLGDVSSSTICLS